MSDMTNKPLPGKEPRKWRKILPTVGLPRRKMKRNVAILTPEIATKNANA